MTRIEQFEYYAAVKIKSVDAKVWVCVHLLAHDYSILYYNSTSHPLDEFSSLKIFVPIQLSCMQLNFLLEQRENYYCCDRTSIQLAV